MHRLMLLGIAISLVTGCSSSHRYTIKMTPRDKGFRREVSITYWPSVRITKGDGAKDMGSELPSEETRKHLAVVYGKQPTVAGKSYAVSGSFRHKIPADVHGSGRYQALESELGTAYSYVETTGDAKDSWPSVVRTMASIQRLAGMSGDFLAERLKNDPKFQRIRGFLKKDFRTDCSNVAFFLLARSISEQQNPSTTEEMSQKRLADAMHRAGLYLVARGYVSVQEIPEFVRIMDDSSEKRDKRIAQFFQRMLSRKMGYKDGVVAKSLAFLDGAPAMEKAFYLYLPSSPTFLEYKRLHPKADPRKLWDQDGEQLLRLIFPAGQFADVDCELESGRKPWLTNGKWDAKKKTVSWKLTDMRDPGVRGIMYAHWVKPNDAFQKQHFGKVIVDGRELTQYALWRNGLSQSEAKEWNAFLGALRPGPKLAAMIRAFRFTQGKAGAQGGLAKTPREIMLEALTPKQ